MKKILFLALLLTALLPMASLAASSTPAIIPDCDPSHLPNPKLYGSAPTDLPPNYNPCGIGAFAQQLKNIIKFLTIIIIPIAFCMIGYAGFIILTSGGNSERLTKGKGMIKIALTGVLILLGSYLLIQFIFNALGVPDQIGGNLPSPVN